MSHVPDHPQSPSPDLSMAEWDGSMSGWDGSMSRWNGPTSGWEASIAGWYPSPRRVSFSARFPPKSCVQRT